ncbi:retrovirus-related Pol polyprotein from type-2 retrotransposable element R2DM [Trichonephila clavata]|uniref:Retrovirus-related Pol polyprotein from type-2 retrotransposable element R2DM n=1 Tax=Trichonephila clavata TaxID=2740835 RepID=A0A8X6KDX1_TRICU|nr:retrovirus-related Pol polyprotein from type-2 retrotransposable element R2DM [Trichonephila clavata]
MPRNSRKSSSQPPFSSTPRRHFRGSPVAHRTRRQISFVRAVQIGLCKICHRVLPDTQSLWDHIKSAHSPSAKQQCCLNSFPTEFHFDANLAKANAWEIFFGTTSCPQLKHNDSPTCATEPVLNSPDPSCSPIKQCVSPEHSPVPVFSTLDLSLDAVEKGLMSSFSQPTARVSDVSVVPSGDCCVPDQVGSQTVDTGSPVPLGLSHSWCAPTSVYTLPSAQLKGSEHSKSLPLNLISVQCDSPIWPTVSPVQTQVLAPVQPECTPLDPDSPITEITGEESTSVLPCGDQASDAQIENLPTVHTVCEIQPKTRSPTQPKSPDILDIVLGGDISLPESPDFAQLKEAWPGELNGSPPHPAFSPPSYAAITANRRTPKRATLFFCVACDKKFYTQHGLQCHVCASAKTLPDTAACSQQKSVSFSNRSLQALPPRLQRQQVTNLSSKTGVVCLFCERVFRSQAALAQHSRALHGVAPQAREPVAQCNSQIVTPVRNSLPAPKPVKDASKVSPLKCPDCDFVPVSKKSLFYHVKDKHQAKSPPLAPNEGPSKAPFINDLPLSFSGNVLQASFPMAAIVPCPMQSCTQNFATTDWSNASSSIRAHLRETHSIPSPKTYLFCSLCSSGFFEHPDEHSCLKSGFILKFAPKPQRPRMPVTLDKPPEGIAPLAEQMVKSVASKNQHVKPQVTRNRRAKSPVPKNRQVPKTTGVPPSPSGVDIVDDIIRYSFPLPRTLQCPVSRCTHSFSTRKWYTTNTSLKRHLTSFHRRPNLAVQFWCSVCGKTIHQPAKHKCLLGASLVLESKGEQWACHECDFSATTKTGLDNHVKMHKREAAAAVLPRLDIPSSTVKKRKKTKAKLDPISSGDPGGAQLAPPAAPRVRNTAVPVTDDTVVSGRADVAVPTVLDSFNEALDTLLEVDEISDRLSHFENLVDGVVEAVQGHFNLVRPQNNQNREPNKPKGPDLQNPQATQRSYRWNRRKCVRQITQANSMRCPLPRDTIASFYEATWANALHQVSSPSQAPPVRPPITEALSREFVLQCLKSSENSAPGPDLITYKHWREVDPGCVILTKIFNVCLRLSDVPKRWKCSNTILIQKCDDPVSLNDWRPISLSDTAYKLLSKCLARKLSDWCEVYEALSPAQKGFSPFDGVIEHNYLLSEHLETARRDKCERFVAWLDIANAFGSIPHSVILEALQRNGVDQDFLQLVKNIYTHAETRVLTEEGPTDPIPLMCGEAREERSVLAFADDIVLLAKTGPQLQLLIDKAFGFLNQLHLVVNPAKCATLHLSGSTPVGARPSSFKIGESELRSLSDHDAYSYLGKPVGFFLQKNFADANEALRLADAISKSNLAQWQKLDALKTFFFPSLSFAMRTDQLDKTAWSEVDKFVRGEVKSVLALPTKASAYYLHASRKSGGCSIPQPPRIQIFT